MRWVRSWPANPPAGRAHVVDDLERLVIDDYDYTGLGELGEDVIVIEWDVAIDPAEARKFEQRCARASNLVRVAPYRLRDDVGERWAHRRTYLPDPSAEAWVTRLDPACDYFGFGLAYLPAVLIYAFLSAPAPDRGRPPWAETYHDCRLTDQTFSTWHRWRGPGARGVMVPIEWDLPAVHLH